MAVQLIASICQLVYDKHIIDPQFDAIVTVDFECVALRVSWQEKATPFNTDVVRGYTRDQVSIGPVDIDQGVDLSQVGLAAEPSVRVVLSF